MLNADSDKINELADLTSMGIDPQVLAALPKEIIDEFLIDLKNKANKAKPLDPFKPALARNTSGWLTESIQDYAIVESGKTKQPTLNGRTDEHEIDKMLKSWVSSCKRPLDEDVISVSDYIAQLITSHNLERVDTVVRVLKRAIDDAHAGMSFHWNYCFELVLNKINQLVQSHYEQAYYMNMVK